MKCNLERIPADGDEVYIRDVSEAAAQESKRITIVNLLAGVGGYTAPTRSFFIFPHFLDGFSATASGDYAVAKLSNTTHNLHWAFGVPSDFGSLDTVRVVFIEVNTTSNTFDWTVTTDFAADNEAYQTNSDSVTANGYVITKDLIGTIDISAAFTGIAAGDYAGVKITLDAQTAGADGMEMLGLEFKYSE